MSEDESPEKEPEWANHDQAVRDKPISDTDKKGNTEDKWDPWNPCPECGSVNLEQIIRETYHITVDEGGNIVDEEQYGSFADQYVECIDCGAVLLDEL